MKNFRLGSMLLLVTFISFTVFSCNKDDDPQTEKDPQQTSSCWINILYDKNGDVYTQFTYNEDGKIDKATLGGITLDYQYSGNTIVIEGTNASGEFVSKSTYILNNKGYVINVRAEYDETGTSWTESQYEYEDDVRLVKSIGTNSTNGSQSFVQTYIWENGNLVSSETGTGKITTYSFYMDMPKQPGEYLSYTELIGPGTGAKLYDTKNALKSFTTENGTTSFTYQTDDDGKIVAMLAKAGTNPNSKVGYGYECK